MSRKTKKSAKNPAAAKSAPAKDPAQQAETHLRNGRYRDAIALLKKLRKGEGEAWQPQLIEAYRGRAEQLAAKEMYQEAISVWEAMTEATGSHAGVERVVEWLLVRGQWGQLATLYAEHPALDRQRDLQIRLGARLLAEGDPAALEALPESAPARVDHPRAEAALLAWCRGDADRDARIAAIRFRSPYRDLRRVLQALARRDQGAEAVESALGPLRGDSPYAPLAAVVRLFLKPRTPLPGLDTGATWLETLRGLNAAQRHLALRLLGVPSATRQGLEAVVGQARDGAVLKTLRTALADCDAEGQQAIIERLGPRIMGRDRSLDRYGKALDAPLEAIDRNRLQAQHAEAQNEIDRAAEAWEAFAEGLLAGQTPQLVPIQPEQRQQAAAETLMRAVEHRLHHIDFDPGDSYDVNDILPSLERITRLDPSLRRAHLKGLDLLRDSEQPKAYDRWLEQAVQALPEDTEITLNAARAATQRQSYVKAARYAETVLARDPIHREARSLAIQNRMQHAIKLALKGDAYRKVAKPLGEAATLARDEATRGEIQLLQGLFRLRAEGAVTEAVDADCRAGGQRLEAPWAHFLVRYWGERLTLGHGLQMQVAGLMPGLDSAMARSTALGFCRKLTRQADRDGLPQGRHDRRRWPPRGGAHERFEAFHDALVASPLREYLQDVATLPFTEAEWLQLTDLAFRLVLDEALAALAGAALEQHPDHPRLTLYRCHGQVRCGQEQRGAPALVNQVLKAYQQAQEAGDRDTLERIFAIFPHEIRIAEMAELSELDLEGGAGHPLFDMLRQMMNEEEDQEDEDADIEGAEDDPPDPPPAKPRRRAGRGSRRRRRPGDDDDPDDPTDDPHQQAELF